jgi:hypothetical protein
VILVDSSSWIDYLRGNTTPQAEKLDAPRGTAPLAIEAARNFRRLRALDITVRKTIDTVIATRCILDGLELLHSDRDFDPFEQHLGLRCVRCET